MRLNWEYIPVDPSRGGWCNDHESKKNNKYDKLSIEKLNRICKMEMKWVSDGENEVMCKVIYLPLCWMISTLQRVFYHQV